MNFYFNIKDVILSDNVLDSQIGVVTSVNWSYILDGVSHRQVIEGTQRLSLPTTNFVDFDNLDKSIIIGWITNILSQDEIVNMQGKLLLMLEEDAKEFYTMGVKDAHPKPGETI